MSAHQELRDAIGEVVVRDIVKNYVEVTVDALRLADLLGEFDAIAPPVAAGSVDTHEFQDGMRFAHEQALIVTHNLMAERNEQRQRAEKAEAELESVVDLAEVVIKVLDGYHENLVPINRNSVSVSALRRQIAKFQQD